MDKDKVVVFEQFARKAAERLEERKKLRTETLKVKSLGDMEIEIRGLTDAEINDCMDFSEDSIEIDKYTVFMASKTLQEASKILVEEGTINQQYKITDLFTSVERKFIANRILLLSGVTGDAGIEVMKETEEVKNS